MKREEDEVQGRRGEYESGEGRRRRRGHTAFSVSIAVDVRFPELYNKIFA